MNSPLLDTGSVGIGSGFNACAFFDLEGRARPPDNNGDGTARCNIGAFEAMASQTVFADSFEIVTTR